MDKNKYSVFNYIILLAAFIALAGTLFFVTSNQHGWLFPFYIVLANSTLGLIVYFHDRKNLANISFGITTLCVVLWTLSLFVYWEVTDPVIALRCSLSAYLSVSILPASFVYFTLNFPKKIKPNQLSKNSIIFIFLPAIMQFIFIPLKLTVAGVTPSPTGLDIVPGPLYWFFAIYFIGFMLWAFCNLLYKSFSMTGQEKVKIRYVFSAYLLGSIFPIFTNLIIPMFFTTRFARFGPFSTIVFVGLTTFAITKHRLLDISVIISRTLAETLTVLFHGTIYLSLVWLHYNFISQRIDPFFIFWTLIYGVVVGQTHQNLRLFLQTTSDKLFLRGKYDYYRELSAASARVGQKLSLNSILKILYETFSDVVEVSRPRIFLPENFSDPEKGARRYVVYDKDTFTPHQTGEDIDFNDPIIGHLVSSRAPITEGQDMVVPCLLEDRLIAVFVLGKKLSEDAYTDEDLRLLQVLASQAAITLDHTRSYEKIRSELDIVARQLERSQRLASLGTLIAGVTHEIRNPLAVIRAETERLTANTRDMDYLAQHRELILKHVDRITGIVERMLNLAKEKPKRHMKVDLNQVIDSTLELFPISKIKLNKELNPIPPVAGDPDELHEVFVNLIQNAMDAMPNGGSLTIHSFSENNRAIVEVKDTGKGIPEDIREKIFDPFFSTRHEGVGLGLSIVYRIVREHGGDIEVNSIPGNGTVFKLSF